MYHLFCNALVHVIYFVVSGQCLYTISHYDYFTHQLISLQIEVVAKTGLMLVVPSVYY